MISVFNCIDIHGNMHYIYKKLITIKSFEIKEKTNLCRYSRRYNKFIVKAKI